MAVPLNVPIMLVSTIECYMMEPCLVVDNDQLNGSNGTDIPSAMRQETLWQNLYHANLTAHTQCMKIADAAAVAAGCPATT
jgi:hypothetical protein